LVTEEGKDVIKSGERGELWLRGPSVMKGYWRNEEATKNTFAEGGWFMTGDVAEIYDDGYFAIVDRVKELIKYKGFQGMSPPHPVYSILTSSPASRTRSPPPNTPKSSRRSSNSLPLSSRSNRTTPSIRRSQSRSIITQRPQRSRRIQKGRIGMDSGQSCQSQEIERRSDFD
jgi:hypothetical protein